MSPREAQSISFDKMVGGLSLIVSHSINRSAQAGWPSVTGTSRSVVAFR